MKVYFSPEYSGSVLLEGECGVLMDTLVVNTVGLVQELELRLGIHHTDTAEHVRLTAYYNCMARWIKENPGNVLARSFNVAGLSTAKEVLSWRDQLRMAGWDFGGANISGRLVAIAGIEKTFNDDADLAARTGAVISLLNEGKLDCSEIEIEIPTAKEIMRPLEAALLDSLEKAGATLSVFKPEDDSSTNLGKVREMLVNNRGEKTTLDEADESLLIYQFPDEREAGEYLSWTEEPADVWISADNKRMDNWLRLMGKPATGSVARDCSPQLTQMFVSGIGLFYNPLNVVTLIEWLNMPLHPLNSYFRSRLAECIVSEGGYRNEACRELIKEYIDGKFVYLTEEERLLPEEEQQAIREKDRKSRMKKVEVFLPAERPSETISKAKVSSFLDALAGWARQQTQLIDDELWIEQLFAVASMADALSLLLNSVEGRSINEKTLDSWVSSIYTKRAFTNAIAEQGSRLVVDSPAKLIPVSDRTIWVGVEGDASSPTECSFLYPSEREALIDGGHIRPWNPENEIQYYQTLALGALTHTCGQLVLTYCERRGGEPTQKHPFIVRLEKLIENYKAFIREPKISEENRTKTPQVRNSGVAVELEFDHADKLRWPDHLSPTAVGTLAEHPLDFLLERMLNIVCDGKATMGDLKRTQGNVAHAVIEHLFAPRDDRRVSTPEEIAGRIAEEYAETFAETVEAKGAILQLRENRLQQKLFNEQLRSCLDSLLEILADNRLCVTACEQFVEDRFDLGLSDEGRDMLGFIDMTLEDEYHHPVVFDFKWTSSRSHYRDLLEANRSIQLEFYREMLGRKEKDVCRRVAYFLMPQGRLYSKEAFKGKNCFQVSPVDDSNIVQQLCNSIRFRKEQLSNGIVETNGPIETLTYVQMTEELNLYLLESDGLEKAPNIYSPYGLFYN